MIYLHLYVVSVNHSTNSCLLTPFINGLIYVTYLWMFPVDRSDYLLSCDRSEYLLSRLDISINNFFGSWMFQSAVLKVF